MSFLKYLTKKFCGLPTSDSNKLTAAKNYHPSPSNQLDSNQLDSNQLDSNQLDSNQLDSNQLDSNQLEKKAKDIYKN